MTALNFFFLQFWPDFFTDEGKQCHCLLLKFLAREVFYRFTYMLSVCLFQYLLFGLQIILRVLGKSYFSIEKEKVRQTLSSIHNAQNFNLIMSLHFLGSIELDDGFISGNDSEHFFLINVLRTLGSFSWWLLARLE